MKIAITSQNKREITGHAGKCRKFWIYEINEGKISNKELLEFSKEESLHEVGHNGGVHPVLENLQAFITGGMGQGMVNRLQMQGIDGIITSETDPDKAITAYLAGTLPRMVQESHSHSHGGQCGCNH